MIFYTYVSETNNISEDYFYWWYPLKRVMYYVYAYSLKNNPKNEYVGVSKHLDSTIQCDYKDKLNSLLINNGFEASEEFRRSMIKQFKDNGLDNIINEDTI